MYEKILTDPIFYLLLFKIDSDLAKKSHRGVCKACGGKLDWANYLRKPRWLSYHDKKNRLNRKTNLSYSYIITVPKILKSYFRKA